MVVKCICMCCVSQYLGSVLVQKRHAGWCCCCQFSTTEASLAIISMMSEVKMPSHEMDTVLSETPDFPKAQERRWQHASEIISAIIRWNSPKTDTIMIVMRWLKSAPNYAATDEGLDVGADFRDRQPEEVASWVSMKRKVTHKCSSKYPGSHTAELPRHC